MPPGRSSQLALNPANICPVGVSSDSMGVSPIGRRGYVMAFAKVETQVNFPAQEREVLAFWERTGTFEALRAKNKGGPRWSFLDGPITANNPMGVHHAWGRTYKDAF